MVSPHRRTYGIWHGMVQRVTYPKHKSYPAYSKLGMEPRWASFREFVSDMGYAPEGLRLGRIDNDRGYYADNCRWVTLNEQARNRRNIRYVTAFGETKLLVEWAEQIGVPGSVIRDRIDKMGWSPEDAVSTPLLANTEKGNNRMITFNGETHSLSEWARRLGANSHTALRRRIDILGWPLDRALTTPFKQHKPRERQP